MHCLYNVVIVVVVENKFSFSSMLMHLAIITPYTSFARDKMREITAG